MNELVFHPSGAKLDAYQWCLESIKLAVVREALGGPRADQTVMWSEGIRGLSLFQFWGS